MEASVSKRKSAEDRLAAAIQEMGLEKAEAAFRLLKSYTTPVAKKSKATTRAEQEGFIKRAAV